MIKLDKLWETMNEKGISTYQLREKCGIDSKTIHLIGCDDVRLTKQQFFSLM